MNVVHTIALFGYSFNVLLILFPNTKGTDLYILIQCVVVCMQYILNMQFKKAN